MEAASKGSASLESKRDSLGASIPAPSGGFSGQDDEGEHVIVIQPGSLNTVIGRATDVLSKTIPSLVAFRRKEPLEKPRDIAPYDFATTEELRQEALEALIKEVEEIRDARGNLLPGKRTRSQTHVLQDDNSRLRPEKVPAHNDVEALDAYNGNKNVIVGKEVYHLPFEDKNYDIFYPFDPNYKSRSSPSFWRAAVVALIGTTLQQEFNIPSEEFADYRVVMILPDTSKRSYIRDMIDLCLRDLGFEAIVVHHASVCATYGAGVTTACVVDLGHTTCDISCVMDGISIPESRIQQPYGGGSIEEALVWDLLSIGVQFKPPLDSYHPLDRKAIRSFKETYCTYNLDEARRQRAVLMIRRPGQASKRLTIQVDKQITYSPLGLFFPAFFGLGENDEATIGPDVTYDSEDVHYMDNKESFAAIKGLGKRTPDIRYTKPKGRPKRAKEDKDGNDADMILSKSSTPTATPIPSSPVPTAEVLPSKSKETVIQRAEPVPSFVRPLSHAIMSSILSVTENSRKQNFAGTILMAGGCMRLKGMLPMLQQQLYRAVPYYYSKMLEQITVIDRPKEIDPEVLSWKGGTIVAALGVTKECWLTSEEWEQHGVRAARERMPFEW